MTTPYPIVGAHFRPPAKAILLCLPRDCPLILRAEPDNPYDSNAIQVLVKSADIPESQHETLATAAMGQGKSLEEILAQDEWHLGYIPRTRNEEPEVRGATEGTLGFALDGKPTVSVLVSVGGTPGVRGPDNMD